MATIIKNYKIVDAPEHVESDAFTVNYWGSEQNERMFPIPFWKVSQMLALGNSNQIALKVRNIDRPQYVSAQWMILEASQVDALQDPVEKGTYYFVMDDTIFDGPIITNTGVREGIIKSGPLYRNIIWGRLGKSKAGEYFAFFLAAECKIIDGGAGGSGPACGAKVPPGGDPNDGPD